MITNAVMLQVLERKRYRMALTEGKESVKERMVFMKKWAGDT